MPLLFSYGTLQQENVQLYTFGRLLQGHKDELPGYEQSLVMIEEPQIAASSGRTHHAAEATVVSVAHYSRSPTPSSLPPIDTSSSRRTNG